MDVQGAFKQALSHSTSLTSQQNDALQGLEGADRDRMIAQFKLQNYQEMVSFVSNMMKKRGEIAMTPINNLR
jgi:hypothetical protein